MQVDSAGRRTTLDGARRRRIYLFRHGSVDYFDPNGEVVEDTDAVVLNDAGFSQATLMRDLFADMQVDKAQCSGLPRTRQTGEIILGGRGLELESNAAFSEIRQIKGEDTGDYDIVADVAFSHWRAHDEEARFLGGERYSDFYARIAAALDDILEDSTWNSLAVFAHGVTNAAILGWVTGLGRSAFGIFDQATCCLNVIDVDMDESGRILRKMLRAMNVTAGDPLKGNRHTSDMETLAQLMLQQGADAQST
jgi:probable phosphoglycerate mutase